MAEYPETRSPVDEFNPALWEPNRMDDAARDLGLFNVASALPQSLAPAIASAILISTGSYSAVFVIAGLSGLLAGLTIAPVRRAR